MERARALRDMMASRAASALTTCTQSAATSAAVEKVQGNYSAGNVSLEGTQAFNTSLLAPLVTPEMLHCLHIPRHNFFPKLFSPFFLRPHGQMQEPISLNLLRSSLL